MNDSLLWGNLVFTWHSDALKIVETDFLQFCRAESRLRPHHSLRPPDIPHHRQFTLCPPINLTNTIAVLDTNKQRYRDALTFNFVHVLMLSS